ncbi:hypothetical protein P7K49_036996 [Saguinus oedipus]|uniref:Piezo TM1-24 domain-containing protein n=1 Tax=Saguinus oedipus TaxID=9490 RepID=A0ABQ9TLQ5_SAGOE|nr:hypothetical protein P7K49_036996 [Saguinus oedipus]
MAPFDPTQTCPGCCVVSEGGGRRASGPPDLISLFPWPWRLPAPPKPGMPSGLGKTGGQVCPPTLGKAVTSRQLATSVAPDSQGEQEYHPSPLCIAGRGAQETGAWPHPSGRPCSRDPPQRCRLGPATPGCVVGAVRCSGTVCSRSVPGQVIRCQGLAAHTLGLQRGWELLPGRPGGPVSSSEEGGRCRVDFRDSRGRCPERLACGPQRLRMWSPPVLLAGQVWAGEDDDERDVDTRPLAGLQETPTLASTRRSRLAARFRVTAHWLLVAAGRALAVTLLALAGIAHPSALSSVYLLVFLAICTWWACHFPISALGFSRLCIAVGCFGAGHLICLYCYQTPFAQALLPPAGIWARAVGTVGSDGPSMDRVLGLKDFVGPTNCSSPHELVLNTSLDWPTYASPGVLLLLCYATASLRKLRAHHPSSQVSGRHPQGGGGLGQAMGPKGLVSGPPASEWVIELVWSLQREEAAKGDDAREPELELELAELDQWPQDGEDVQVSSRMAGGTGPAPAQLTAARPQHVVPTTPDTEAENCIVHELTGQSPVRQRPWCPGSHVTVSLTSPNPWGSHVAVSLTPPNP